LPCRFVRFAGARPVTRQLLREFLFAVESRGVQLSTVHVFYRALKTWFNWLVAEGLLEVSPMVNIKPPKVVKKVSAHSPRRTSGGF